MPNKDGTANVLDGLKHIGIALVFAVVIVLVGSSLKHAWLLFLVTPALCGLGGWLVSRQYSKTWTDIQLIGAWAVLGLVIATFWFFFGI
jgi:hypothetical protein